MKVKYYPRDNSPDWWVRYTPAPGQSQKRHSSSIPRNGRKTPEKDSPLWEYMRLLEDKAMRQGNGMQATIIQKPIGEFFSQFHAGLTGRRTRTLEVYLCRFNTFTRWCDTQKLVVVSDITSTVAMEYIDHLKTTCATSTVKSLVTILKMAFDDAKKRNFITFDENPFRVTIKGEAPTPKRAFTQDEINRLLTITAPVWLPPAIRIALYTGARSGSVQGVQKTDILFDIGTIWFDVSKTTKYAVPMHPELVAYLKPLAEGTGPLLPDLVDKSAPYFPTMFARSAKAVGVTGTFHQFRHTFITRCAEAGMNPRFSQQLANHTDAATHKLYTHANAALLAPEILKVKFA